MPVSYKTIGVKMPPPNSESVRYIARPAECKVADTETIGALIASRTSLSRVDVIATLTAFSEIIPDLLLDNHTVHLKPLGIFSLSFKSTVHEEASKVTLRSIKEVKLNFRPDKSLTDAIRFPEFKKAK